MKQLISALLVLLILVGLVGCASAGGTGSTSPEADQQSAVGGDEPGKTPSPEATYQPTGEGDNPEQPSPEATYQPTGEGDNPGQNPSPEAEQTGGKAEEPGDRISEESAWQIALEHAELTKDQVTGTHIEFEYDDGVPEYSVEFSHNGTEFEYEIHGQTGEILSYERDN